MINNKCTECRGTIRIMNFKTVVLRVFFLLSLRTLFIANDNNIGIFENNN